MKRLLIIISLVLTNLISYSQPINKDSTIYNSDGHFYKETTYTATGDFKESKELIADETWITRTKTGAKIQCYNESVFYDLLKSHGTLFKRFTCTWKTDRHGKYKEYVAYLSYEDAQLISKWSKTNL